MSNATIRLLKDSSEFVQEEGDTILRAALRSGVGFSYECNSGGCGGCKFELVEGNVETLWGQAPGISDRDIRRGRHLACQCRASGPITINAVISQEYVPKVTPRRRRARLLEVRDISHDIREFRFVADGEANFLPGQYAMLDLPGMDCSRAYSVSNTSNEHGEWHFQIRRVTEGRATGILFDKLRVGEEVGLDGPYGVAYLRTESPRSIVCVAGGSGLAPMISIARGASEAGLLEETRRLYFFYGARTARDVCGEEMLSELAGFGEKVRYFPVISQLGEGEKWHGPVGFVHDFVPRALPSRLADFEFYFAGPPAMTQAIQELLMLEHEVPFEQIHFDRFY